MFFTTYPTLTAVRTHIGKSPVCLAARMGIKEIKLEILLCDAMWVELAPLLNRPVLDFFVNKE